MQSRYELKYRQIGPGSRDDKELCILNRVIRWTPSGIEYEADQRHAEAITAGTGVAEGRRVSTPGTSESQRNEKGKVPELQEKDFTVFRPICARLNFLAQDRPDLQFVSKNISAHMAKPTGEAWCMLVRVGRYLKKHSRMVQVLPWSPEDEKG